jgi:hypothetical protein
MKAIILLYYMDFIPFAIVNKLTKGLEDIFLGHSFHLSTAQRNTSQPKTAPRPSQS